MRTKSEVGKLGERIARREKNVDINPVGWILANRGVGEGGSRIEKLVRYRKKEKQDLPGEMKAELCVWEAEVARA